MNALLSDTERYIKSFVSVSKSSFLEFAGIEAEAGRPYFIDAEALAGWDISAVIALSGDTQGAVAVSIGKEAALRLADKILMASHSEIDEDVTGSIGEIVNLIAGKVKRNLEGSLQPVISLPVISRSGESLAEWFGSRKRIVCVPFIIFGGMTFILSVSVEAA